MSIYDYVSEHYSKPVSVVHASLTLEEALLEVSGLGARRLVVESAGRIIGVAEPFTIVEALAAGVDLSRVRVSSLRLTEPVTITPYTRVYEAILTMLSRETTTLLVTDSGGPVGIFTSWDAIAAIEKGDIEEPILSFGPPMRRVASPWTPLGEAVRIMAARGTTSLVLTESGIPSAVLSLRSIISHLLSGGALSSHSVAASDPLKAFITPEATVSEAAEAMTDSWSEAAAIVAAGRLIGVVTETDILVMAGASIKKLISG